MIWGARHRGGSEGHAPLWHYFSRGAKTGLRSAAEERDQLVALAFGQPGDRLRRRDPTLGERARGLGRTDLRQREQEVVDLRRLCELRWLGDDLVDPRPPRGELPLQPRPSAPDLIRVPQGTHPLIAGSPRS